MSTANPAHSRSISSTSSGRVSWKNQLLIPYAIAILAQLPMLAIYARDLWSRPHYQFAPFALIATLMIAWSRWPRNESEPYRKSAWSSILLVVGLVFGVGGYLFLEPWFTAFSVILMISSLLARTLDRETGRSLWTAALPLFTILVVPFSGDFRLITWLQRVSAQLTSRLLDLVGMGHHMPGTSILVPGKAYDIENACSGVQSFFTLLFVAVVFAVWKRRSFIHGLLLVIASGLWAIFMNTVRILLIPLADRAFELDLSTGVSHALLGYSVLAFGILMLLSTDQFLLFLFGPVDATAEATGPFGRFFSVFWNRMIAGEGEEGGTSRRRRRQVRSPVSGFGRVFTWGTAILLAVLGGVQFLDVARSYAQPDFKIQFFSDAVVYPFDEADLPEEISTTLADDNTLTWERVEYLPETRTRGSDLGLRSDSWIYRLANQRVQTNLSLDQTFPGWHELTVCYQHAGWKLVGRVARNGPGIGDDEDSESWQYVEAEFEKPTGERAFLVFSLFDAFGEPLRAPAEWGEFGSFLTRAKNRLSHRIRGSLFQSEAYQAQVFYGRFGEIPPEVKEAVRLQYFEAREILREAFLRHRAESSGETASSPDAASPDADAVPADE